MSEIKSKSQHRRLEQMVEGGFLSKEKFEEMKKGVDHSALPEKVEKPKKVKSLIRRRHTRV